MQIQKNELGKGSDPRPMNISKDQFEKNFDRIFRKQKPGKHAETPNRVRIHGGRGATVRQAKHPPGEKILQSGRALPQLPV